MLRMQYSPNIANLQTDIEKLKFDNIMYRITGLSPNSRNAQQITIQTTVFDENLRFIAFACNQGRKLERQLCMDFYNVASTPGISTSLYLDIIFQLGSQYVHIEKQNVEIQVKQISASVVSVGHKEAYIQVMSKSHFPIPPNSMLKVKFTVLQNSNSAPFEDPALTFEVSQAVSTILAPIRFACNEKCMTLMSRVQSYDDAFYQLELSLLPGVIFGDLIFEDDYRVVQGVVMGISLLVIAILIVTSIIGIVLLMKQMKKQSKRKAKKL